MSETSPLLSVNDASSSLAPQSPSKLRSALQSLLPQWSIRSILSILLGLGLLLVLPTVNEEQAIISFAPVITGCAIVNSTTGDSSGFSLLNCFDPAASCLGYINRTSMVYDTPLKHDWKAVTLQALFPLIMFVVLCGIITLRRAHVLLHMLFVRGIYVASPPYAWLIPESLVIAMMLFYSVLKAVWMNELLRPQSVRCPDSESVIRLHMYDDQSLALRIWQTIMLMALKFQGAGIVLSFMNDAFGRFTITFIQVTGGTAAFSDCASLISIPHPEMKASACRFLDSREITYTSLPIPVISWDTKIRPYIEEWSDELIKQSKM